MTTTPTLASRADGASLYPPDIDVADVRPEHATSDAGPDDEPEESELDDDDDDPGLDDGDDADLDDGEVDPQTSVSDLGQATTEYALVLLGAALVALLLIGWATSGGGAGKVGHLLDTVLDAITKKL